MGKEQAMPDNDDDDEGGEAMREKPWWVDETGFINEVHHVSEAIEKLLDEDKDGKLLSEIRMTSKCQRIDFRPADKRLNLPARVYIVGREQKRVEMAKEYLEQTSKETGKEV